MRRVVLITGGAGGMGRAIASRFVGGDDTVVLADLSEEALTWAALEVPGVDTIVADVTSFADCDRIVATTATRHGGGDEAGYLAELIATLPQGARARFIRPEEIASVVAFLASAEAAPITGVCMPVEWGVTAGY